MIKIHIDKLYRYARRNEPCFIGFPLPKGKLKDPEEVRLYAGAEDGPLTLLPIQARATGRYEDDSVRFLFLRFLTDLPANAGTAVWCDTGDDPASGKRPAAEKSYHPVRVTETDHGYRIQTTAVPPALPSSAEDDTGASEVFSVELANDSDGIWESITVGSRTYRKTDFSGPSLSYSAHTEEGPLGIRLGKWEIVESGPICVIMKNISTHGTGETASGDAVTCEIRLTFRAGRADAEVSYRIINTTPAAIRIDSLVYGYHPDRTGLSDGSIRTCVASSNYTTDYAVSETGEPVSKSIDADWLVHEANEHFAEVFHGTFFADCTDDNGGLCATIFQAHQNYPKALEASRNGIRIMLVPETSEGVVMQSGMAREQRFLLCFHPHDTDLTALNDQSILYQMPYRPYVSPQVHRESEVWPQIFADRTDFRVERNLIARADGHGRAYGMMNFGDSYDSNYTAQGRGGGKLVWCNNEYDFPHSCALMFVRTGIRRFLDYNIASCSHWMDVDVCHFHTDPLYVGGQWEHSASHILGGVMVCSHQWVEGLLDYYHFTGDERGLSTAIGIGENVQRLLDTPAYAKVGESNARETGWALRTLTALYVETSDKRWLEKCDRIVNDFKIWEETYGHWLAPYTDNTLIRVGFMISVAIGSLMRYYRVFPKPEIKGMILRAVDDLIENCYVPEWGIFYYKELPSLNRLGNNTLLLEALTAAYDLSGDNKYLTYGTETFRNAMEDAPGYHSSKQKIENAVLVGNMSSKNFAQSMIPLSGYYRAVCESKSCGKPEYAAD